MHNNVIRDIINIILIRQCYSFQITNLVLHLVVKTGSFKKRRCFISTFRRCRNNWLLFIVENSKETLQSIHLFSRHDYNHSKTNL